MIINIITILMVTASGVNSANTTVCHAEKGGYVNCKHLGLTSSTIVKSQEPIFTLDLAKNLIEHLPANSFSGLNQLQYLYLHNNLIQTLPGTIFQGLTFLKELLLHYNLIKVLPDTLFHGLTRLNFVNLNRNKITALPRMILNGLSNLYSLYIEVNPLGRAPEDLIQGLPKLTKVHLLETNIKRIDCEGYRGTMRGDVCFGLDLAKFSSLQLCSLPSPPGSIIGAGKGVNGTYRVARYAKDCAPGEILDKPYIYKCNAQGIFTIPPEPRCTACAEGFYGNHCEFTCYCYNGQKCDPLNGTCSGVCKKGFNGSDCEEDIDECVNVHLCPKNSTCLNTYGSFKCVCHIGYSFVGKTCALPSIRKLKGLSSGAITGIVACLGIILVIALTIFYKRNRSRKQKEQVNIS